MSYRDMFRIVRRKSSRSSAAAAAGKIASPVRQACRSVLETLEARQLFAVTVGAAATPGFDARYFANNQWKGAPVASEIDANLADNNFGAGSPLPAVPVDNFSAIYSAKVTPTATGTYSFDLSTVDDQGQLFISGPGVDQFVVADKTGSSTVDLTAGTAYTLIFLASEFGGNANFSLQWITPNGDGSPEPIPTAAADAQVDAVTAAPTELAVNDSGPFFVRIGYTDNSQNEVKYQLERATVVNGTPGDYTVVAEGLPNSTELFDGTANPGTSYSYRVVAFNFAGQATSAPFNVTTPARTQDTGATGAWYASGFWGATARPAQNALGVFGSPGYREEVGVINFGEPTLNRDGQGIPTDNFSTAFTGKIVIPEGKGGEYKIISNTDDDGALFVNGQLVSYDPGGHGQRDADTVPPPAFVTPITLQPGSYNFVLLQAEQGGGAGATLKWEGPATDGVRDIIPQENLTPIADTPAAPTEGAPDAVSAGSVQINFADVSTSEIRYEIQQSTDPTFATIQKTYTAPINATRVTATGLTPATTYYFRIRGVNLEGAGAPLDVTATTSAAGVTPVAPSNLSVRYTSPTHGIFSFTDNSNNEESFLVFRREGSGDFVPVTTLEANTTTFQDDASDGGLTVTYRIIAHSAAGDSAPLDFTTKSGAPGGTGLLATAYANTTFTDDPSDPTDTRLFIASQVNNDFGAGAPFSGIPADNFSIVWKGSIQAEKTEPYTFQIEGADQASLVITDAQGASLANLPLGGGVQTTPAINLVAGQQYNVEVRLVALEGNASAFLRWQSPTTPLEAIPQTFLFPTPASGGGTGGAQVYIRGANWTNAFRNYLSTQSGQDSNIGYRVTGFGATSEILPFSNVDTIAVKFTTNVPPTLTAGSVTITSAGGRTYTVQSVGVDPGDPTLALIKLASPILNDRVRIQLEGVSLGGGGGGTQRQTIFAENFDNAPLQDSVDEHEGNTASGGVVHNAWSPTLPGWDIDRSQMPGFGDPTQDGVTEWSGWAVASNKFWGVSTDDQRRREFTKSKGNVLVADPDEWDDNAHAPGQYNSFATTPTIDVSKASDGNFQLSFDSSWRPEGNQTAHVAVSYDDGATFDDVLTWTSVPTDINFHPDTSTNESVAIVVPLPTGATSMKLRFGMTDAGNNWFWAVDNVKVTANVTSTPSSEFRLNVLPGDVNQSGGAVNAADLVLTRNRIGRSSTNPGTGATAYSVFNDINGDGLINASDLVLVRNNVGKALPAAPSLQAGGDFTGRIAPAQRDRDLLDELK